MDQFELLESVDQLPEGCDPSSVLCTLYGPFADYSVPCGNGYWYSAELYDKVLESPNYKEFMQNRVNFAEGDHPSDSENRSALYLPKVSHAYRDVVNDKVHKRVMGKVDILDTPDGRVLYTLVKYGAKLGVSSRGEGDLIIRDIEGNKVRTKTTEDGRLVKLDSYGNEKPISATDHIEVDPDTYIFYAWDIVHQPSNQAARMDILVDRAKKDRKVESKHTSNLMPLFESLKGNREALTEVSKAVESSDLLEKKQISYKLREYVDMLSGDEDSDKDLLINKLKEDLQQSAKQYIELEERYNKLKTESDISTRLDSVLSILNQSKSTEPQPLIGLSDESQDITLLVESQGDDIMNRLEEIYNNLITPVYTVLNNLNKIVQTRQDEREIARDYYDRVVQQCTGLTKSIQAIQVPETIKVDENSISYLSSLIDQVMDKVSELELDLHSLTESNNQVRAQLVQITESKLNSQNKLSENRRYLRLRCSQLGLNYGRVENQLPELSSMTLEEIDESLADTYGQSQFEVGPISPILPENQNEISRKIKIQQLGRDPESSLRTESLKRLIQGNADLTSE